MDDANVAYTVNRVWVCRHFSGSPDYSDSVLIEIGGEVSYLGYQEALTLAEALTILARGIAEAKDEAERQNAASLPSP